MPKADVSSDGSAYWKAVDRLWERSTGGSKVATAPGADADGFWPEGPSAPAAQELVDWLIGSVEAGRAPAMVFLVGGPGNGKSALANRVDRHMRRRSTHASGLAYRTYEYQSDSGRRLTVVNDATIPPEGGGSKGPIATPLIDEVNEALANEGSLLANINRGVLYEELSANEDESPGERIVRWLARGVAEQVPSEFSSHTSTSEFVQLVRWTTGLGLEVTIAAVFMDVCSLCERRPVVALESPDPLVLSTGPYEVARLGERAVGPPDSPALELLGRFVEHLDVPHNQSFAHDPVWANIQSLKSKGVRNSIVTCIRAAELATSKRLTYRELWGAFCRLVVGDLPQRESRGDAVHWMAENQVVGDKPIERFGAMATLAGLRFHQGLFGARPFGPRAVASLASQGVDPVLSVTSIVDPARDARPGRIPVPSGGWADPVLSAMGNRSEGESPLEDLLRLCVDDVGFQEAVTEFDRELDRFYVEAVDHRDTTDGERRGLDSWYGEYLLRLYGSTMGRPAFCHEIDLWTLAWRMAPTNIPTELKSALRTLLQPKRDPSSTSSFVLPLYDARAIPVTGNPEDPRLGFVAPDVWALKTQREGDALEVRLMRGDAVVEQLQLDFPLLREAMACSEGHLGITEYAQTASPRLERFRASMLRPSSEGEYVIVVGPDEFQLSVIEEV